MKKRDILLTTEAHRPAFDAFADALRSAESREGWRSAETMRYFLDAGFRAVRGRTLVGEEFDRNEAEYMAVVNRCRHPAETMKDLSRMLGALALAMRAEPVDFVGPVFCELSSDKEMGQYFTPHCVSYMMAKMIVGDDAIAQVRDGNKSYLTLSEPSCGVGGMVLATNLVLREGGLDLARHAHWHMVDVDHRAMCAAYLQTAMTDCSAVVCCGNSLSLELRLISLTPAAILFPKNFRAKDQTAVEAAACPAPPPAEPDVQVLQLSLF